MARHGLLIDYQYCTGCHSCEVACQMEHKLPVDQWGIKLTEIGPWQITAELGYNYVEGKIVFFPSSYRKTINAQN